MSKVVNLSGQRFGRLVAIELARIENRRTVWRFSCDCGALVEKQGRHVLAGRTTSCGCFRAEGSANRRHGMTGTPEYRSWSMMLDRCTNPRSRNYADYGGRGISVCARWRDFATFYADMGTRPGGTSLDRIDVNDGYYPDNCRWASAVEQRANRRDSRRAA